ncbi:MAG: hypothetical protein ABGZ23_01200 [Fuerstiella sp.]
MSVANIGCRPADFEQLLGMDGGRAALATGTWKIYLRNLVRNTRQGDFAE